MFTSGTEDLGITLMGDRWHTPFLTKIVNVFYDFPS